MSKGNHWAGEAAYRALLLQLQAAQLEIRALKSLSDAFEYDCATDEWIPTADRQPYCRTFPVKAPAPLPDVSRETFPPNALKHSR